MLESLLDELREKETEPNQLDSLVRQFVGGLVDSKRIDPTPVPRVETPADLTELLRSIGKDIRQPDEPSEGERADILGTLTEIMSAVGEMEEPPDAEMPPLAENILAQGTPSDVTEEKQEAIGRTDFGDDTDSRGRESATSCCTNRNGDAR